MNEYLWVLWLDFGVFVLFYHDKSATIMYYFWPPFKIKVLLIGGGVI